MSLCACSESPSASNRGGDATPLDVSFYYWKTVYDPGPASLTRLRELDVQCLYLRFFEVTLNERNEPVPHATTRFDERPHLPVAPVIYFDLKVFSQPVADVDKLARNLVRRIMDMAAHHDLPLMRELHVDCDWTPSTRERFFEFTAALKKALPEDWELVATLRLDQVKNFNHTGVPKGVDRGLVMAYNMGNLRQPGAHNSIIDPRIAAIYLKPDKPYPLPLDIALPLFRWVVVFNAQDEFAGLLRDVPPELFDSFYCRNEGQKIYTVIEPFNTLDGWRVQPGYRLRLEDSPKEDVLAVAKLLAQATPQSRRLIFFHLDDKVIGEWPAGDLIEIVNSYH